MTHRVTGWIGVLASLAAVVLPGRVVTAQAASQPAEARFDVNDWAIFVCDAYQPLANPDGMVTSALPAFIDGRRQEATGDGRNEPSPIGIVRISGRSDERVDVMVRLKGRVMASWPKAEIRGDRLLWRGLAVGGTTRPAAPLAEGNWFAGLRTVDSAPLTLDEQSERFLLYDVELRYVSPLKISGGKDFAFDVVNNGSVALHDVNFYKPEGAGWRTAHLTELAGVAATTRPATSGPAIAPSIAAATRVSTSPAVAVQGISVRLAAAAATQPADVLADWRDRLIQAGMAAGDADVAMGVLRQYAVDPRRLTVVYRLDAADMDRLVPLEVLPDPRKSTRVGLVIVRNADPTIAGEIDELITQLGDDDWAKREEASKALAKLGPAAKEKLQKATNNPDPEIAWRAEQLVAGGHD